MTVLVLGVGNILLSDEGIGVRVIEALQDRYRIPPEVEVIDGGTAGMDLLDTLSGRRQVIIVDAVRTGGPPGSIVRLVDEQVPAFFRSRISPHQLGLSDVLAALSILGSEPQAVTVIGVEPADLSIGLELSPVLAARLDELVERVVGELRGIGLAVAPRTRARPDPIDRI
jgi:hydrogenase maturation protease